MTAVHALLWCAGLSLVVGWGVLALQHARLRSSLKRERREHAEWRHAQAHLVRHIGIDLRNRLNAVTGLADLLLERPFPPEKLRVALMMRGTLDDLTESIANITTYFSDFRDGAIGSLSIAELPAMLARLHGRLVSKANQKGIHFDCLLEPGAARTVMTHADVLERVLANVLEHSIAVTDHGFVELLVHAGTRNIDVENPELCVTVRDSSGLTSRAALGALFESYGLDRVRRGGNPPGTGLHLVIAKRLSEHVGGVLVASSDGGEGTLFTLTMTATAVPDTNQRDLPHASRVQEFNSLYARHKKQVGKLKVLVIDDQESNQFLLVNFLVRAGHDATGVSTGEDGLKLLTETPFDVIMVDLTLPGITGNQLLRMQRDSPSAANRETPMIVVTGDASLSTREKSFHAGAQGFVTKPISAERVLDAIARVVVGKDEKSHGSRSVAYADQYGQLVHLAPRMIARMLADVVDFQHALKRCIDRQNWDEARRYVRQIRGAAVTLDAKGMRDMCDRFLIIREPDIAYSGAAIALKIHAEIDDLRMEINDQSALVLDDDDLA